jgi:hypothetical protein
MSTSAVTFSNTVTKTAAQIAAEVNKNLGLIAGANPNQAIGPSQQAAQAQSLKQKLDTMSALGQTGTPEYAQALAQWETSMMNAFNIPLTPMEQEQARSMAFDEYAKDPSANFDKLVDKYEKQLIDQKMEDTGLKDLFEEQNRKMQEEQDKKAPSEEDKKKETPQSILQQLITLMQKIEPRIPVANLT